MWFSAQQARAGGWRLVTAGADGTARLWDAATGHQLSEPLRHEGAVTYAEFSPDGTWVLTQFLGQNGSHLARDFSARPSA